MKKQRHRTVAPRPYEDLWKSRRDEIDTIRNSMDPLCTTRECAERLGVTHMAIVQAERKAIWKIIYAMRAAVSNPAKV